MCGMIHKALRKVLIFAQIQRAHQHEHRLCEAATHNVEQTLLSENSFETIHIVCGLITSLHAPSFATDVGVGSQFLPFVWSAVC
jgi:hypothetical protein